MEIPSAPAACTDSFYRQLPCGAQFRRHLSCAAAQALFEAARYHVPRCSGRGPCNPTVLIPPSVSYDADLVGSFFSELGYPLRLQNASNATRASVPLDGPHTFVYASDWWPRALSAERCGRSGHALALQALTIGSKGGLCAAARRAAASWPAFAAAAVVPRCFRWPEERHLAGMLFENKSTVWMYKDLRERTYGGLEIAFFSRRRNTTDKIVMRRGGKAGRHSSYKLQHWRGEDGRRRGLFQQMVHPPYLVEERSNCFRVFVLLTSSLPLRAWAWRNSYVMVAGLPYKNFVPDDPAVSSASVCAAIVNSFHEKRFCIPFRNRGARLFMIKLPKFLAGAAEALGVSADELWARIERAIRFVLLADYSSFAGAQGQQLLGFDLVLDADGNVHVLEANRTPGTTEDDAGRKRRMHQGWATMTGGFAGAAYPREWRGCRNGGEPACKLRARVDAYAAARRASGGAPRALERELLFEWERERALAAAADTGAGAGSGRRWTELYPGTAAAVRDAAGHLALLNGSTEIGAAVRATHALQLDYLEWIEQNGTLASQTK